MSITLKVCDNNELWNTLLDRCPNKSIFHKWELLKIMEKHSYINLINKEYKCELYPIIGYKNESPIGLYPLFLYKVPFMKCVFSPPLRSGAIYQGPLIIDSDKLKQSSKERDLFEFQKSIDNYVKLNFRARLVKIVTSPNVNDVRFFSLNNYLVEPCYTYEINIDKPFIDTWNAFDPKLRYNVKKTTSYGIKIKEGTNEDVALIFDAFKNRLFDQGLDPYIEYEFLMEVFKCLNSENLKIFVSEKDGKQLSGLILLLYKSRAIAWIGTTRLNIKGLYPNDLLLSEAIKWSHENGFKVFELMGANTYRLCKYKSKFNPDVSVYYSCTKTSSIVRFLDYFRKKYLNDYLNP